MEGKARWSNKFKSISFITQVGELPKRTNSQNRIVDSGGSGKILKTQSVNFWASYIDNGSLYNSDGLHLSKKGKEKLGDLINLNLYNLLYKSGNYQGGQIDKIG